MTSLAHSFALSSASEALYPGEVGAIKSNLAQISAYFLPLFLLFPTLSITFVPNERPANIATDGATRHLI